MIGALTAIDDFTALSGIGKGTASVIEEYMNEGKSTVLRRAEGGSAERFDSALATSGLGGKKIAKLHKELHVNDVNDLENRL